MPKRKKSALPGEGKQPARRGEGLPAGNAGRPVPREKTIGALSLDELAGTIRALLTIEGVEGVGQPVTLISPADLPPDFLGFVERLRGGAIELDEEMLLITLAGPQGRRRRTEPVLERVREALKLLARYATDKGVSASDVLTLLDERKR